MAVAESFDLSWGFALQGMLARTIEENFPGDLRQWPILNSFDIEPYDAGPDARLFVLRDRVPARQIPSIDRRRPWPDGIPPFSFPGTLEELQTLMAQIREKLEVRPQDALFLVAVTDEDQPEAAWNNHWSEPWKALLHYQMALVANEQHNYVRGFKRVGNFVMQPGYEFLSKQIQAFFTDHPNYDRNVFIMSRFDDDSRLLTKLDTELRRALRQQGFNPVRADDKMYMPDRNLWNNVCVYMLCCRLGVAILEDRVANEFNPNVALEYGFMRGTNKPALLLADKAFRNLRADIFGTLRETFDLTDIETTVEPALKRWLTEIAL